MHFFVCNSTRSDLALRVICRWWSGRFLALNFFLRMGTWFCYGVPLARFASLTTVCTGSAEYVIRANAENGLSSKMGVTLFAWHIKACTAFASSQGCVSLVVLSCFYAAPIMSEPSPQILERCRVEWLRIWLWQNALRAPQTDHIFYCTPGFGWTSGSFSTS